MFSSYSCLWATVVGNAYKDLDKVMGAVRCFDVINVGAATPQEVVEELQKKLCVGGVLAVPVHREDGAQVMRAFHKLPGGVAEEVKARLSVRFVPLTDKLEGQEGPKSRDQRTQPTQEEEELPMQEVPESARGSQIPSQDSFQESTTGANEDFA